MRDKMSGTGAPILWLRVFCFWQMIGGVLVLPIVTVALCPQREISCAISGPLMAPTS